MYMGVLEPPFVSSCLEFTPGHSLVNFINSLSESHSFVQTDTTWCCVQICCVCVCPCPWQQLLWSLLLSNIWASVENKLLRTGVEDSR